MDEIAPRNPQAEARLMLGEGGDARVLEPSPPAVALPPWFADDPTAGAPLDWSPHDVDVAWREERWLGPFRRLSVLPAQSRTTRRALHELAEQTISPARAAVNGKIGLRWTLGGFGTPFFGADEQLRVEHGALVHQRGDRATRTAPAEGVDPAAASALGEYFRISSTSCRSAMRAGNRDLDPSPRPAVARSTSTSRSSSARRPRLRPASGAYGAFGPATPVHPEPYLYVGPWAAYSQRAPLAVRAGFAGAGSWATRSCSPAQTSVRSRSTSSRACLDELRSA